MRTRLSIRVFVMLFALGIAAIISSRTIAGYKHIEAVRSLMAEVVVTHRHDMTRSHVLDESLYRTIGDSGLTGSPHFVVLITDSTSCESCGIGARTWVRLARMLMSRATTHVWILTNSIQAPEAVVMKAFQLANMAYRIVAPRDVSRFVVRTGIRGMPMAFVIVGDNVRCAFAGPPDQQFLDSCLARVATPITETFIAPATPMELWPTAVGSRAN